MSEVESNPNMPLRTRFINRERALGSFLEIHNRLRGLAIALG